MERFDAIVIGGGPAGATASVLLARAGWRIAVVEKAEFPRRKVCGEFISATTWPLLDALGASGLLAQNAGPAIARIGIFAGSRTLEAALPGTRSASGPRGRALGREHLDTALLAAAERAGALVFQPWSLDAVDGAGDELICTLAHRSAERQATISGRVVLAAHGSWEHGPLATQTARRAPRGSDLLGFKARFARARLPPELMPLIAFPGGYGGLVTTSDEQVSLSCCIRRDALASVRARHRHSSAGDAVLAHIVKYCDGAARTLDGARRDGPWLGAGPLATGIRSFGTGRIVAIGNAAAEAHPIVAEGISMAIQSAHLACAALATRSNRSRAALDVAAIGAARRAYERAWRRNFTLRLRAAAVYAHLFMRPATSAAALAALSAFPDLLRAGIRWSGKSMAFRPLPSVRNAAVADSLP